MLASKIHVVYCKLVSAMSTIWRPFDDSESADDKPNTSGDHINIKVGDYEKELTMAAYLQCMDKDGLLF